MELELNIVYSFWSKELIEIHLKFTKVSFFVKLKKIDMKEFTGLICTEFQVSISANFNFNWLVNLFKKRL
jgi:hypothetical protein